jgi:hypothetical protein
MLSNLKRGHPMTRSTIFIAAALALVVTLPAAPAYALAARTFLSAAGSDSNNCANVATPCRHLATAYANTAPDGEIYVLDPANYGSLTITHGVSIEGHGWASIAPVVNGAAITISANSGDKINIIGVVLDGTALANTTGIQFFAGGTLTVRDSVIRNFADGLAFLPNASSELLVSNTLVSDNGSDGIVISINTPAVAKAVLDNVTMENNASEGLLGSSSGGAPINVMVRNSTMAHNGEGLSSQGTSTTVWLTRSTITENGSDFGLTGNSTLLSYGDNNIVGNTSTSGTPTLIGYK